MEAKVHALIPNLNNELLRIHSPPKYSFMTKTSKPGDSTRKNIPEHNKYKKEIFFVFEDFNAKPNWKKPKSQRNGKRGGKQNSG